MRKIRLRLLLHLPIWNSIGYKWRIFALEIQRLSTNMAKKKVETVETPENVQQPTAEAAPAVEETAAAPETTVEEPVAPAEPSKRDKFRTRVSQRYTDLNMDDEDAYYDQMGSMMDEYEGYEKNSQRLRDSMSKTPAFAEMLLAARDQDDFDPVAWMVQERGLDLQEAMDDPEYAKKIAAAHEEYLAKQAKGKEIQDEMLANLPGTLDATRSALEEAGFGDKYDEIIGNIFQLADDITMGKWDPQIAVQLAKGGNYDTDVTTAREEGRANGLNTKVDDKLRTLNRKQERVPGTQTPAKPKEPKKPSNNMFMA